MKKKCHFRQYIESKTTKYIFNQIIYKPFYETIFIQKSLAMQNYSNIDLRKIINFFNINIKNSK